MRPVSAALGSSGPSTSSLRTRTCSAPTSSGASAQRPLPVENVAVVRDPAARDREVRTPQTAALAPAHASGRDLVLAARATAAPRAQTMLDKVLAGLYRIQQPNVVGNYIDIYA